MDGSSRVGAIGGMQIFDVDVRRGQQAYNNKTARGVGAGRMRAGGRCRARAREMRTVPVRYGGDNKRTTTRRREGVVQGECAHGVGAGQARVRCSRCRGVTEGTTSVQQQDRRVQSAFAKVNVLNICVCFCKWHKNFSFSPLRGSEGCDTLFAVLNLRGCGAIG